MPRGNRKVSQKRARVNRASGRHAFDSAPIGLALVGPDGRFLQVNPRLCSLLGYAEKQLLASTLGAVTDPHDLKTLAARSRRLLDEWSAPGDRGRDEPDHRHQGLPADSTSWDEQRGKLTGYRRLRELRRQQVGPFRS